MTPVTVQTLHDLGTLNKETLMVLIRYHLGVDNEIPPLYLPVLLGKKPFPVEYPAKNVAEQWVRVLFSVFYASPIFHVQAPFLHQNDDGAYYIAPMAKHALEQYVSENSPLEAAMLMPLAEWRKSKEYLKRFDDRH